MSIYNAQDSERYTPNLVLQMRRIFFIAYVVFVAVWLAKKQPCILFLLANKHHRNTGAYIRCKLRPYSMPCHSAETSEEYTKNHHQKDPSTYIRNKSNHFISNAVSIVVKSCEKALT